MVLPRVSTAGSLRMIARRRAMRETPMASVMVTAAGRPSGIAPTASATAAMNISNGFSPRQMPSAKVAAASARIAQSTSLLKCAILRVRGVERSVASEMSHAMRPISVLSPVAQTTPSARPYVTSVPAKARLRRSARMVSSATTSPCFSTGTDSPVRADSSTCKLRTWKSRRSAGTLSPDSSSTRSPGTRSSDGTRCLDPPRRTVAAVTTICASALIAFSARDSWR